MKRTRTYSETVRNAAELLGAQVRQGRITRGWTIRELADRAGIDKSTVVKVERGEPTVALGTAFDLAVLVGVPLFYEDRSRLASEARRERETATLMGRRVRHGAEPDIDYDF
jgi:transcriptional regulator with XRE-family HTH domain